MIVRNETVANFVHAVAGTNWIRISAGDGKWTNWQVTIVFAVGVTSGNKPTCRHCRLYML